MCFSVLAIQALDVLIFLFLFWLIPFKVARLAVNRLTGISFRPVDILLRELPGTVTGLAIGALGIYLFNSRFEEFAVKQSRAASQRVLELVGID